MINLLSIMAVLAGLVFLAGSKVVSNRISMLPATSRIIGVGLVLIGAFGLWVPD
jgi:hypothetical protein